MMCLADVYFFLDDNAVVVYEHEDVLNSWEAVKSGIISKAEESRQLIKLLNRKLRAKTIYGIQLNIEGYPMPLVIPILCSCPIDGDDKRECSSNKPYHDLDKQNQMEDKREQNDTFPR
ncbi:hypothetical protein CDAR_580071 [Caerostris darwini]|uniref:Uncharacterized protein n=1 Tax=Caerostris darwini TaxID=1538125 RepID=A0AAV4PMH7_9ARAC|nr:hypothetical protein CDAR_580071 [Caerostris darwini]